jgi:hypothetical protein
MAGDSICPLNGTGKMTIGMCIIDFPAPSLGRFEVGLSNAPVLVTVQLSYILHIFLKYLLDSILGASSLSAYPIKPLAHKMHLC